MNYHCGYLDKSKYGMELGLKVSPCIYVNHYEESDFFVCLPIFPCP